MSDNEPEYRRRIRQRAEQGQRRAEREDQKATEDTRVDKIVGAIRWETRALVFAAIVAIGAIIFASRDSESILSEMQAEQRPWVSVADDPTLMDVMSQNASGVHFTLKLSVKNTGKNPAIGVQVSIKPDPSSPSMTPWDQICGIGAQSLAGASAFAGEVGTYEYTTVIPTADLNAFFGASPNPDKVIFPIVSVCVRYIDAVTRKQHHTPYVYLLAVKSATPPRGCCGIFLGDMPIKADNLTVTREAFNSIPAPD